MSRFPKIAMAIGLGMLAAGMAVSAHADAPKADGPASLATADPVAVPSAREKRLGSRIETTRLEAIIVSAGAVDRHHQRFVDSPAATAVLPTVPESAFLDGDGAETVESR